MRYLLFNEDSGAFTVGAVIWRLGGGITADSNLSADYWWEKKGTHYSSGENNRYQP